VRKCKASLVPYYLKQVSSRGGAREWNLRWCTEYISLSEEGLWCGTIATPSCEGVAVDCDPTSVVRESLKAQGMCTVRQIDTYRA